MIGAHKVPSLEGAVIAANHVSYLDPLLIGTALKRRATFMAMEGLFKTPVIGTFVSSFSFPVRIGNPRPSTIKEAVKRLKRGELIVVFPEGGRSADGDLRDAKRGVGMIAATSSARVFPVFIEGADSALPVGAQFIRPAKVRVTFGDPLEIKNGETGKHYQERIAQDTMNTIRNLNSVIGSDKRQPTDAPRT